MVRLIGHVFLWSCFLLAPSWAVEHINFYQESKLDLKNHDQGLSFHFRAGQLERGGASSFFQSSPFPLDIHAYDLVRLDSLPTLKTPGLPQWPYSSFLIVADIDEIEVYLDLGTQVKVSDLPILPAPQMPCRCLSRATAWFERRDHPLLNKHVVVESVGEFRGRPLSRVTVTPFSQTSEGTFLAKELEVHIQGAASSFDFYKVWRDEPTYRILIVGPEVLLQAAGSLLENYSQRGYEVDQMVYRGESFRQLQERIHRHYRLNPFDAALILGDEEVVPMERVMTSADWSTPSDMNYFTMGGPDDKIPDVVYGRLVANHPSQIQAQIEKMFHFKKGRFRDDRGLERGLMVSSDEGFNPTDEEYSRAMMEPMNRRLGLSFDFYVQGRREATANSIITSLNRGSIWMNYIGHGEGDRWPSMTGRPLTIDHLRQLEVGQVQPIVIDVACQNGRLSFDGRIGERLMNQRQGVRASGALAYYGGSVDISWHPPAQMAVYINDIVSTKQYQNLGEVLLAGQLRLVELFDDLPAALENLVWYHLQGDPLMSLEPLYNF